MKDEKDWSKATDDELIEKTVRDYKTGVVINCLHGANIAWTIPEDYKVEVENKTVRIGYAGTGVCCVFCYHTNQWAEIISQPKEASPEAQKEFEENNPGMIFKPEPKAGDMVEVLNPDWRSGWTYLGVKNTKGYYICEEIGGKVQAFEKIRLPQKSEVRKQAECFLTTIEFNDDTLFELSLKAVINGIEWGQANPTKK